MVLDKIDQPFDKSELFGGLLRAKNLQAGHLTFCRFLLQILIQDNDGWSHRHINVQAIA